MDNILQAHGFDIEIGGGGCQLLTHYIDGGGFVWVTCLDGGGLPDADNWMICAYGDDIGDIIYELRSDQNSSGLTMEQSVVEALAVANAFEATTDQCAIWGHRDSGRGVCVNCGDFLL
jgi:hypothetical protein